jgi:hypothetical protein
LYITLFNPPSFADHRRLVAHVRFCLVEQRLYGAEYAATTQFERWKDQPVTRLVASELGERVFV